jgi:hypothetical protein
MTASDAGPGVCGLALDIATVTSHRAKLWVAGYRPVPVVNCDATVSSPGKQPLGKGGKWPHAKIHRSALPHQPSCTH